MCCEDNHGERCCEKPGHLKGRAQDCTPEQIRECHGEAVEHPCAPRDEGQKLEGH